MTTTPSLKLTHLVKEINIVSTLARIWYINFKPFNYNNITQKYNEKKYQEDLYKISCIKSHPAIIEKGYFKHPNN